MNIAPTVSEHFRLDKFDLRSKGAFDVPLDGPEANVYVDPRLLRASGIPEFKGAMDEVTEHYGAVLADIEKARESSGKVRDAYRKRALDRLHFREIDGLRIGYGKGGSEGRAIGPKRAKELYRLANTLVRDEFEDPILFEMFTIVETGIGADLISDLITFVTRRRFYEFSQRVGFSLNLPIRELLVDEKTYHLPWNPLLDKPIIFPPHDAVADIPAFGRSARFEAFATDHESLRKAFSDSIKIHRGNWRRFLKQNPEHRREMLAAYQEYRPPAHDAFRGTDGARLAGKELYANLKDKLQTLLAPRNAAELHDCVLELCMRFKEDVESGRARRHLHGNDGPRDEKHVHGIFRAMASSFCQDRDIKLSPESDAGVGPVDFLFDRGASAVTVVEVKLSTNTALLAGYSHQTQAYKRANGAHSAVYYVVDLMGEREKLQKLVSLHDSLPQDDTRPYLIVADGRQTPSASKMRTPMPPLPQPTTQPRLVVR